MGHVLEEIKALNIQRIFIGPLTNLSSGGEQDFLELIKASDQHLRKIDWTLLMIFTTQLPMPTIQIKI